jgi:hypothetical protein
MTVTEKAQDAASSLTQRASDMASNVGRKAEDAASAVADKWEAGREYLSEQGFKGVAEDVTSLIRRHPIPALLVAFGLGFMVSRTMRD